jgi:subtilase family serine protease
MPEMQLAVSPAARYILVYNAPNDTSGQTELDEYTQMANDDAADVISSSWAFCENDLPASFVQAENLVFEQMAVQGQSTFASEGDTGAFACLLGDGTTMNNVWDPAAQPWVTSVGGTSLESDNPGTNPSPVYPAGVETVWNVDNLCNSSANEGGESGFFCNRRGVPEARRIFRASRPRTTPDAATKRTSENSWPTQRANSALADLRIESDLAVDETNDE